MSSKKHEYSSPAEHMKAMKVKLDAFFKKELDSCIGQVSISQEDLDTF